MSLIGRTLLGLVAAAACAAGPAALPASAAPAGRAVAVEDDVTACEVTYVPESHWGGFTAEIVVRNTGNRGIYGWTLVFPLEEGVEVVSFWKARMTSPKGLVTAHNEDYNGDVEPGGKVSVGFLATGTATKAPEWFTVNGVACAIAPPPTGGSGSTA